MKYVSLLLAAFALAGCEVSPREVGSDEFDPGKVAYFKDKRTGLCFAVVSYTRLDSAGRAGGGLSHSVVPCSNEVLALVR